MDYKYNVLTFTNVAAMTDYEVQIDGEIIIYQEGNLDVKLKINNKSNDLITRSPKQFFIGPFQRFYITTLRTGNFVLFVAKPKDISIGSLEGDSDMDQARGLKKYGFIGSHQLAPVASQYGYIGIWNPPGSGIIGTVDKMYGTTNDISASVIFIKHNAAIGGVGGISGNKYLGGPAPVCQIYVGTDPSALGISIGRGGKDPTSNGLPIPDNFKIPIIIEPGLGLYLRSSQVNVQITSSFQWYEI